jgi:hypothetical protein
MADADDDVPIFRKNANDDAPLLAYGAEIEGGQAAQERPLSGVDDMSSDPCPAVQAGSVAALRSAAPNVWGKKFCFDYYGSNPGRFRQSTATFVPARNTKPITYEVKRNLFDVKGGSIRIPVRLSEHRMFYIAYTEETGPILINVIEIARDADDDWSQTIRVYRVYQAREAVLRADRLDDVSDEKGQVKALGRASLEKIAAEDGVSRRTTYHCGDRLFWMDVRNVVGVVRWSPVSHRGQRFTSLIPVNLPCTDILYVGTSISEPPPLPPRS